MINIEQLGYEAQKYLRRVCPYDTGNLNNSISVNIEDGRAFIKIGGELAPYAVYTNERWVAPRWKGAKNPNEKWIDNAVKNLAIQFSAMFGGELSYDEEEEKARYSNKNYWDSDEGKAKIKEYGL